MQMNEELKQAAERIRRVEGGERHRTVYDFENEEMDDFNYRMLENAHTADLQTLADAYLAEHPADDGKPAWRDRPPVAGKYLKYRRTSGALFAKATIVACPEHTADVDLYRWYGPIPADAAAGPVESTP